MVYAANLFSVANLVRSFCSRLQLRPRRARSAPPHVADIMSLVVLDENTDMTLGDPSTGTGGVDGGQMGTDGVVLKLLLPEKETGQVIGKGGSVLTKIKLDSGARVRVSNIDEVIPMTRERVCTIVGTLPAVLLAQKLVSNALVENARPPMDEVRRIASASASTSASSSASSLASPLAPP